MLIKLHTLNRYGKSVELEIERGSINTDSFEEVDHHITTYVKQTSPGPFMRTIKDAPWNGKWSIKGIRFKDYGNKKYEVLENEKEILELIQIKPEQLGEGAPGQSIRRSVVKVHPRAPIEIDNLFLS